MKIFLFILFLIPSFVFGNTKTLSLNQVKEVIPCTPPLVSHWIQEKGFANKVSTQYGDYEFTRTDVGEPDGKLTVNKNQKSICEVKLSLNPDIYFSSKLGVMALSAYSGSSSWFEIYKVYDGKCYRLGKTTTNSKDIKELFSENDGSRTCKRN